MGKSISAQNNKVKKLCGMAAGAGQHKVEAMVIACGKDILVALGGGTNCHIGATATAVPRPSLADGAKLSASASVLCVTGHKEDEIARGTALSLASACNCVVTVVAGIHIDGATSEDIAILKRNCECLAARLSKKMSRR
ncbi:MAG: hypothetical protein LBN33_03710 [Desulfovibrio sp.]|nr:hypothetical protein [Desulfovibrio sp.]